MPYWSVFHNFRSLKANTFDFILNELIWMGHLLFVYVLFWSLTILFTRIFTFATLNEGDVDQDWFEKRLQASSLSNLLANNPDVKWLVRVLWFQTKRFELPDASGQWSINPRYVASIVVTGLLQEVHRSFHLQVSLRLARLVYRHGLSDLELFTKWVTY